MLLSITWLPSTLPNPDGDCDVRNPKYAELYPEDKPGALWEFLEIFRVQKLF